MYNVLIVGSYAPSALPGATPFHGEDRPYRDCNPYTLAHRLLAVADHHVSALSRWRWCRASPAAVPQSAVPPAVALLRRSRESHAGGRGRACLPGPGPGRRAGSHHYSTRLDGPFYIRQDRSRLTVPR